MTLLRINLTLNEYLGISTIAHCRNCLYFDFNIRRISISGKGHGYQSIPPKIK